MAEKNQKKDRKKDNCPLCDISEETLAKLREAGKKRKTEEKSIRNNE